MAFGASPNDDHGLIVILDGRFPVITTGLCPGHLEVHISPQGPDGSTIRPR